MTFKAVKKNSKEKDNNSKCRQSFKDNILKKKLNNNISKKEINYLKHLTEEKKNSNNNQNQNPNQNPNQNQLLRRKRSISMIFEKNRIKEIAEEMKKKKNSVDDKNNINFSTKNVEKVKKKKKNIDFESALKNNKKKVQFNLFSKDKFTNTEFNDSDYLKYTLNCMELILELDIEKQTRLKNKINFNFPKTKKKGIKKKIALFDLDETLVHCTGDINVKKEYQHAIEIKLPGKQAVQVGINLRPCWKQTLNLIKKHYHIVIYTASHQAYADAVLDFMDPKKKYFKYRLYRNNCSLIDIDGAKFYVKDLDILNQYYDLKDIVIIDNSVLSFAYHLHNGIPIVPYYDEDKDGSLYVVGLYLVHIFHEDDLREANKKQINLDSFLEEARKEKENIIDEESDDEEENEENSGNQKSEDKNNDNDTSKKIVDEEHKSNSSKIKTPQSTIISKIKKRFSSHNPVFRRRRRQDFTQKKLISQSKLIKMYYEVKDETSRNEQDKGNESNDDSKKSDKFINELKKLELESSEIDKNSFAFDSAEFDCKSDPGNLLFNFNSNNSDGDSGSDEDEVAIKRGNTIIEEDYNDNNSNKNIKGKLKFIRSNFYSKFKI